MSSPEKTEWTHEAVVRRLAGEMYRSALWAALGTVVAGAILWTVLAGVPGLVAAAALTVKRLAHPMALPAAEAGKGVALGH